MQIFMTAPASTASRLSRSLDLRVPTAIAMSTLAIAALLASTAVHAQSSSTAAPGRAYFKQAAVPAPASTSSWSADEVQQAMARCSQLFKGLDIVAKPVASLRDNDCGTPAPVELISVGRTPQVSFSPPVTVTCDLAAALHKWVTKELQPIASAKLGAPLVRIDTMSSYSCRNAYGRKNGKLSEHGRANAVDLRSFMTADSKVAEVLADWGPTGHEIAGQVAAAKKFDAARTNEIAKAPVATSPATSPATSNVATGSTKSHVTGTGSATGPTLSATGGLVTAPSVLGLPPSNSKSLGLSGSGFPGGDSPNRLGGPKNGDFGGGKTEFLRAAHDSACQIFGTVLGPEANAAHRNHFHVDMAVRKIKAICE